MPLGPLIVGACAIYKVLVALLAVLAVLTPPFYTRRKGFWWVADFEAALRGSARARKERRQLLSCACFGLWGKPTSRPRDARINGPLALGARASGRNWPDVRASWLARMHNRYFPTCF